MNTMKAFVLLSLLLALSGCEKDKLSYLPEYEKFRPDVENHITLVLKDVSDSIKFIINEYLERVEPLSCTFCVVEVDAFAPVRNYCIKNPQCLIYVLESALKGSRLTWGFRVLFKEFYPNNYQRLLDEAGIILIPESELNTDEVKWNNKQKEYSLPFENIVKEYFEVQKE